MRVKIVILRFTGNFKELDRVDLLKMNNVRRFTFSDVNFTCNQAIVIKTAWFWCEVLID